MHSDFTDKVVLITGGGAGIGQACAIEFAAAGAKVVISDITEQSAKETIDMITQAGGVASAVIGDVSQSASVDAMVSEAVKLHGRLDIAVNNAGISAPLLPVGETDEADYDRLMGVNLKGVWLCMRRELQQMTAQGGGNIINMASALSQRVVAGASFYVASKFAVAGMTRTAAVEYGEQNIRINAICPGFVETPLLVSSLDEAGIKQMASLHANKRLCSPAEIANAVLWMASDSASACTGNLMNVDGGWNAY